MKINFLDFWGGFSPNNNFFLSALRFLGYDVELAPISQCDIIFYSGCGNNHNQINRKKTKKIFYTGENVRPNYDDCDMSISFDEDTEQNIRIPLYLLYIDFFNEKSWGNPFYLLPADWIESNPYSKAPKAGFCSAVFSNPTTERMALVEAFKSQYKPISCFGRPFGSHTDGEHLKYLIVSQYKFSLCPENTRYPGYVTEKLFHAKTAGAIPIYSGSNNCFNDFNPKCYIDIDQCDSTEELVEKIKIIDNSDTEYEKIKNEPLFTRNLYDAGGIYSKLSGLSRLFY